MTRSTDLFTLMMMQYNFLRQTDITNYPLAYTKVELQDTFFSNGNKGAEVICHKVKLTVQHETNRKQ